ncbi:MAG: hypothetical protein ACQKBV_00010 [Puniceicoccales bacterium]
MGKSNEDSNPAKPKRLRDTVQKRSARTRRRHLFESAFGELATWSLFAIVIIAGYFGYKYVTTDDFLKNDRFAVVNKDIIEGANYTDGSRRTHLGAPQRVQYPHKHVLIVLGEHTREEYIVVVDEELFRYTPLRTILLRPELAHRPYFENFREMEEYYKDIEAAPEPAQGPGIVDKILSAFGM